ncbi:uncharacterized protein [Rutidosis leptorrhynchoides]
MATCSYANNSIQGGVNETNPGRNHKSLFCTDKVFKSRQDLMAWVQSVGRSLGFFITTKRSNSRSGGFMYKVTLECDRGGIYENKASSRRSRATKKTNCPFELVGTYSRDYDAWTLRVICEKHNHEPADEHIIKGHPSSKRLSDNETRLVLDLTKKNVKPQVILMILKKLNPNNMSTPRLLYNMRQKFRNAGEQISGEEMTSPSPTECPVYAFNGNKSKGDGDDIDPFALRNLLQDIDLSKYGYDMTVTNLVKDLYVANLVKDVSVASCVKEVLMCHDGIGQYINIPNIPDVDASTSAGPFKPYRDIVLDKSQGEFSLKQFLDSDYAHEQFSTEERGSEKEIDSVVEHHTDTSVDYGEDGVNNVYSDNDVAVDTKLDTRDENERKSVVNGTSEFSTDRVFNSRQELTDWVQNVGRSLGYIIITKRSSTHNSSGGVTCKVTLMCDRCGIYKSQSSHRHSKLTKKTNCPFKLVGNNSKCSKFWTLKVICEEHNHEPAVHMKGHPYAMRLLDNETRLVLDLTKKNVKPQVILMILKKLNPNNVSNLRTLYNMRQKFRNSGEKISGEEIAFPSPNECPVYAFNGNKLKGASDDIDPFALRNLLQELDLSKYGYNDMTVTNLVKDVSVASHVKDMLMCPDINGQDKNIPYADASTSAGPFKPYRDVVLDKSHGQISMKHFLDNDFDHDQFLSEEGETEKDREETFVVQHINNKDSANKSKRTDIEENASSSTSFAFDSRTPKRSIDQVYRFDFRNMVDSVECESVREDIVEDFVFQTKQNLMMPSSFGTFSPPHVDIMGTNNGNGLDTVEHHADEYRHFQPNREAVLNMPQREILKKRFLDRDYAHDESLTVKDYAHHTNIVFDSTYREDEVNYVYSDVEFDKRIDTCDESEKKLVVNGPSEFFTER